MILDVSGRTSAVCLNVASLPTTCGPDRPRRSTWWMDPEDLCSASQSHRPAAAESRWRPLLARGVISDRPSQCHFRTVTTNLTVEQIGLSLSTVLATWWIERRDGPAASSRRARGGLAGAVENGRVEAIPPPLASGLKRTATSEVATTISSETPRESTKNGQRPPGPSHDAWIGLPCAGEPTSCQLETFRH